MMTYYKEENNYPKAVAIATAIMIIFIALSYFIAIGTFKPVEEAGMGGMVVNYGTSVTGMGTDYTSIEDPSADPNANQNLPDKVVPTKQTVQKTSTQISDKDIVTQNTEDAVSINTKKIKSNTAPNAAVEDKPAKPTINQNALYKGKANKGTGEGDGTGNTAGNQGSENGDPLAPNYGEGGSGFGETPIPLSKFTNLVKPHDDGQKTGIIVIRLYYNKTGNITKASQELKGSTTTDIDLVNKCIQAVLKASLSKSDVRKDNQTGIVVFRFKVN